MAFNPVHLHQPPAEHSARRRRTRASSGSRAVPHLPSDAFGAPAAPAFGAAAYPHRPHRLVLRHLLLEVRAIILHIHGLNLSHTFIVLDLSRVQVPFRLRRWRTTTCLWHDTIRRSSNTRFRVVDRAARIAVSIWRSRSYRRLRGDGGKASPLCAAPAAAPAFGARAGIRCSAAAPAFGAAPATGGFGYAQSSHLTLY